MRGPLPLQQRRFMRASLVPSAWRQCHSKHALRFFSTGRCARLLAPAPSSGVSQTSIMQARDVITRLAPSEHLPGLRGVFLTKPVKKFHPIEVLPTAAAFSGVTDCMTAAPTSFALPHGAAPTPGHAARETADDIFDAASRTSSGGSSNTFQGNAKETLAPPLVLNLAFAPRRHISLRRFLALRHMFSSADYLHVATEDGWYLVAPSSAAPLCADVAGLQAWLTRHHHRYLAKARNRHGSAESSPKDRSTDRSPSRHSRASGASASASLSSSLSPLRRSPQAARLAKHAELARLEAALDNEEQLTEAQLHALAAQEERAPAGENDDEEEDEEAERHDGDADVEETAIRHVAAAQQDSLPLATASATTVAAAPVLKATPPLILEGHLFDINDGVFWELPPSGDLANHAYWKGHRQRMSLYESTGDADATEQKAALLDTLRADPRAQRASEQELYAAAEALFQTLKLKANVMLSVDRATGLLTLVPLCDLQAGEELLLHYGREWWTGRLLSSVLLAVPDAQMAQVRWVEQLFGHTADTNQLFPLLMPAYQQRKRRRRADRDEEPCLKHRKASKRGADPDSLSTESSVTAAMSDSRKPKRSRLVLYNAVTRRRATDAAVLAFAVRRSCLDDGFFRRLVLGNAVAGVSPVFRLAQPDAEVPMRVLRRVLLASLRGVPEENEGALEEREVVAPAVLHAFMPGRAAAREGSTAPTSFAPVNESVHDDAEDVFSV